MICSRVNFITISSDGGGTSPTIVNKMLENWWLTVNWSLLMEVGA